MKLIKSVTLCAKLSLIKSTMPIALSDAQLWIVMQAARPCKVRDKAKFNRIGNLHEHDRQRVGLPIQCHQRRGSVSTVHAMHTALAEREKN
jgi:hypothetical protein